MRQLGLCIVFGLFAMLLSCGKVVQEASELNEDLTFNLSYRVLIQPTPNRVLVSGQNQSFSTFSYEDTDVYAQVWGISETGAMTSLSWGKANLSVTSSVTMPVVSESFVSDNEQIDASPEPIVSYSLTSTAYRKDGIELKSSDYQWTYLKPTSSAPYSWSIDSHKLKHGYAFYMMAVYTDQDHYALKVVSAKEVSENVTAAGGDIRAYDTFKATLFLMDLDSEKDFLKGNVDWSKLSALYTVSTLDLLSYSLIKNQVSVFRETRPVFQFSQKREETLLKIYKLMAMDDSGYTETKRVIGLVKDKWMTKSLRESLHSMLDDLID